MEKPVIVFLHYFGGSAESWKWVTDLLAQKYHCIAINLPGFGRQPALQNPSIPGFAKDVQQQLALLKITSYVLVGHSMGGKIALQVAANDQPAGSVKQLILLAPSPPTIERMPQKEQQRMLIHPNFLEAETTVRNSTLIPLGLEQHELAVTTQLIADDNTWRWWIAEGIHNSISTEVMRLQIPITVIASKDDPAVTWQMTMEDTIPNLPAHTKLISTEGLGHLFPLEDAQWTAAQIHAISTP